MTSRKYGRRWPPWPASCTCSTALPAPQGLQHMLSLLLLLVWIPTAFARIGDGFASGMAILHVPDWIMHLRPTAWLAQACSSHRTPDITPLQDPCSYTLSWCRHAQCCAVEGLEPPAASNICPCLMFVRAMLWQGGRASNAYAWRAETRISRCSRLARRCSSDVYDCWQRK